MLGEGGVRTVIVIAVATLAAAPAWAQDAAKEQSAELLFQEGQQLIKDGKLAEACPKFEQSLRLDPAIGTLLSLAHCYDLSGRAASAWATYVEAEAMARSKKDPRQRGAHDHVGDLAPLVPKGNVLPGEEITLRLAVWDANDGVMDSLVLLDAFEWSPTTITPGTTSP